MSSSKRSKYSAMSMVEMLVVIGVLAIIVVIALPSISNLRNVAKRTTAIQNAKSISQMSGALAALGVAHVIPDSMGGVAATARLLREGVIVPEGPMAGEKFILSGLRDDEIEEISDFLFIQYDLRELRLIFRDPELEGRVLFPEGGGGVLDSPAMMAFTGAVKSGPAWVSARSRQSPRLRLGL